jgi:hypothetical protein
LEAVQLREVLCDRGVCQQGTLHFLGSDDCLYSCGEDSNFSKLVRLASL